MKRWVFWLFLVVYTVYLATSINPFYLNSDEGSYALTGAFFNRFYGDWTSNPTIDVSSIYDYVKAYYVRYP